jgi:hypothetical protein
MENKARKLMEQWRVDHNFCQQNPGMTRAALIMLSTKLLPDLSNLISSFILTQTFVLYEYDEFTHGTDFTYVRAYIESDRGFSPTVCPYTLLPPNAIWEYRQVQDQKQEPAKPTFNALKIETNRYRLGPYHENFYEPIPVAKPKKIHCWRLRWPEEIYRPISTAPPLENPRYFWQADKKVNPEGIEFQTLVAHDACVT